MTTEKELIAPLDITAEMKREENLSNNQELWLSQTMSSTAQSEKYIGPFLELYMEDRTDKMYYT